MSVQNISSRHSDSSRQGSNTPAVARELSMNPLWMVTFAAGLLFGMLAVLLTSG